MAQAAIADLDSFVKHRFEHLSRGCARVVLWREKAPIGDNAWKIGFQKAMDRFDATERPKQSVICVLNSSQECFEVIAYLKDGLN